MGKLRGYNAPTVVVSDLLNTPACKYVGEELGGKEGEEKEKNKKKKV